MSLVDVPIHYWCEIKRSAGAHDATLCRDAALFKYAAVGVSAGRYAKVLARYPSAAPRFVEVELDLGRFVTLPIDLAKELKVELLAQDGPS
ncbi:MAG: hypothetical protein AB2L09_11925 [Coriobacteriia bacterium]